MSMDVLKEDLKNNRLRNLYLFYGPEEYLKKYYLEAIEKQLLNDGLRALNRVVMEGKADIIKIIDNCETLPVLSEKKVVIVKNSGIFKAKKSGGEKGKGKVPGDDLAAFLQNVPGHVCLVFYEEEIDKRLKLVEIIKKNGLVVEFAFQKPAELTKWVVKVFKAFNKDIDMMTATQLVDSSELGMNEILNEINKVVLFVGDRTRVTAKDIEEVCTRSIKGRIFDLTDAIAGKDGSRAIKLLDDMVILKEPIPKILYMITRQFRQILEMKLLMEKGLSVNEAASQMGITPYAAGKVLKQSKSFTVDTLKRAIEQSLELDIAVKTGMINDRIAVELLISEFST